MLVIETQAKLQSKLPDAEFRVSITNIVVTTLLKNTETGARLGGKQCTQEMVDNKCPSTDTDPLITA